MRGGIEAYVRIALPVARQIIARDRLEREQRRPLFEILDEVMTEEHGNKARVAARLGVDMEAINDWLIIQRVCREDPMEQESWDRHYFRRMTELNISEVAATREPPPTASNT